MRTSVWSREHCAHSFDSQDSACLVLFIQLQPFIFQCKSKWRNLDRSLSFSGSHAREKQEKKFCFMFFLGLPSLSSSRDNFSLLHLPLMITHSFLLILNCFVLNPYSIIWMGFKMIQPIIILLLFIINDCVSGDQTLHQSKGKKETFILGFFLWILSLMMILPCVWWYFSHDSPQFLMSFWHYFYTQKQTAAPTVTALEMTCHLRVTCRPGNVFVHSKVTPCLPQY